MLPGTDGFAITARPPRSPPLHPHPHAHRPDPPRGRPRRPPKPAPTTTSPSPLHDLNIHSSSCIGKSLLRRTAWQAAQAPHPDPALSSRSAAEGTPLSPPDTYFFNNRTIDFAALELIAPNRITQLTVMEADLLRFFTDREGQIIPRSDILEQVWHVHQDTDTRAIDNFIVRLRRYIEDDPANPQHLTTVRGIGYRFLANP